MTQIFQPTSSPTITPDVSPSPSSWWRFKWPPLSMMMAFVSLALGLVGAMVAFMSLWPNRGWLRVLVIVLAGFYVMWGAITHAKSGHYARRIISEYLAVAVLGAVMLWLVI